jgi:hypothetical protein
MYLSGLLDIEVLIRHPVLYHLLENMILTLVYITYIQFFKTFLNLKQRFPFWQKVGNAMQMVMLGVAIIYAPFIVAPNMTFIALEARNYFLLALILVSGFAIIKLAIRGTILEHIFMLGSTVLVMIAIVNMLWILFFDGDDTSTTFFQTGMVLELVIFHVGLGLRLRSNMRGRQQVQQKLIDQLKENEGTSEIDAPQTGSPGSRADRRDPDPKRGADYPAGGAGSPAGYAGGPEQGHRRQHGRVGADQGGAGENSGTKDA